MLLTADTHIMEPTDLFTSQLPVVDHYRAPVYHRLPDGTKLWTVNSVVVSISPEYRRPVAGSSTETELIPPDDVEGFLADLEMDGVWGGVLHPNLGLTIYDLDEPEFAYRCAQIYNDHVHEIYRSERLFPQAVIPLNDIDVAVGEIERVAALGFRGLELPLTAPPEAPYFSHRYDPVWEAAQNHGLLVSMHIGTGLKRGSSSPGLSLAGASFLAPTNSGSWPPGHPDHEAAIASLKTAIGGFGGYGGQAIDTISHLVGGGALDRYPSLHFLLVETGARWLANVMDTMDEAWYIGPGVNEVNRTFIRTDGSRMRQFQDDELGLKWSLPLKPSDYVRRQIHVTFQDDWVALRNRDITGIEPLVWGNDYAHNEGSWPQSIQAIEDQCLKAKVSDEERAAIFGGTLASLLGLDVKQLVAAN